MQLLSIGFFMVYGVAFESIEDQEVLSQNEQSRLSPGSTQTATMIAIKTTVAFGVGEASLDSLTTKLIAAFDIFIVHLLALSVKQFLALQSLDRAPP